MHQKVPPQGTPSLTPLILGSYWAFQREQACLDSSLWPQRPVWGMSMDAGQMMARGRLFVVFIKPRCWVGLVGEDRALLVLWASLRDQPHGCPHGDIWLASTQHLLSQLIPRTQCYKSEQMQCLLSFTKDIFPIPCQQGPGLGGWWC